MSSLDSIVFVAFLIYVIVDGVRKGSRRESAEHYFLAGRNSAWWAIGLSIMATQASAITMIGTTGEGMQDGMRFLQFYFGLPLAMLILAYTLVPLYHKARVFTAYEYLGQRFGPSTRLTSALSFFSLRLLSLAVVIYSPAIVFALLFGVHPAWPTLILGVCASLYTAVGGLSAVISTDVKQMLVMFVGLCVAFVTLVVGLPAEVDFSAALRLADEAGKLDWLDFSFDVNNKYTVWSALLGGTLLFLSYFGCDQSQVQRLLAGKSVSNTRKALLLNALAKVPFQALVLLCGVMLFSFYLFQPTPLSFVTSELENPPAAITAQLHELQEEYQQSRTELRRAALDFAQASNRVGHAQHFREQLDANTQLRNRYQEIRNEVGVDTTEERNYAFPYFILKFLPRGLAGLLLAAIVAAALSSIDSEINALATVAIIDGYCAHFGGDRDQPRTLVIGRVATFAIGAIATLLALSMHSQEGSIIEIVNRIGSHFYGALLGVFAISFWRRANGIGATTGIVVGTLGTWACNYYYQSQHAGKTIAFLFLNTLGLALTLTTAAAVSLSTPATSLPAEKG